MVKEMQHVTILIEITATDFLRLAYALRVNVMFDMYEFDNSSFKHFFKVILCQVYHILVIEITFKRILCKRMSNSGNVTKHDMLIYWLGGETKQHPEPA